MARKGADRKQKRLSASKTLSMRKKTSKWIIATKPGMHAKKSAIPLGLAIRDLLNYARNMKEVNLLLNGKNILVDGKIRKQHNFPLGLFDVLEIPGIEKRYRVLFDAKRRLVLREFSFKGKLQKLCKVVGKHTISGGKMQITTHDGRNILIDGKEGISVDDTLLVELPEQKIVGKFKLQQGNLAYVVSGTHVSEKAKILEVGESTMKKPKLITLETESEEQFKTLSQNVFVIGAEKPAIEM